MGAPQWQNACLAWATPWVQKKSITYNLEDMPYIQSSKADSRSGIVTSSHPLPLAPLSQA
jgi:hypothetical protein